MTKRLQSLSGNKAAGLLAIEADQMIEPEHDDNLDPQTSFLESIPKRDDRFPEEVLEAIVPTGGLTDETDDALLDAWMVYDALRLQVNGYTMWESFSSVRELFALPGKAEELAAAGYVRLGHHLLRQRAEQVEVHAKKLRAAEERFANLHTQALPKESHASTSSRITDGQAGETYAAWLREMLEKGYLPKGVFELVQESEKPDKPPQH